MERKLTFVCWSCILHPVKLTFQFCSFFCRFRRIFQVNVMSSVNKASLILPFQCGRLLFLFLSYSLGMISSTMLNRNGDKEHYCIIPDIRGKTLSFTINYAISCSLFIYFYRYSVRWRKFLFIANLMRNFIFI